MSAVGDPHDLQRYVTAQDPVYPTVLAELRRGAKRTHWMWFVFPQLAGLGYSVTAQRFALRSIEEARAYETHPILGARLRECFQLVLDSGKGVADIFPHPDDLKYHSSATLFAVAAPGQPIYAEALARGFGGTPDAGTLRLLGR